MITKEEKFLLTLYNLEEGFHDPIAVGARASLSPKAVKNICNGLAQANFIKKTKEGHIAITQNGETLAQNLKQQK